MQTQPCLEVTEAVFLVTQILRSGQLSKGAIWYMDYGMFANGEGVPIREFVAVYRIGAEIRGIKRVHSENQENGRDVTYRQRWTMRIHVSEAAAALQMLSVVIPQQFMTKKRISW